jgi:hypothetical protein
LPPGLVAGLGCAAGETGEQLDMTPNGVIDLIPDKGAVFTEIHRVLERPR